MFYRSWGFYLLIIVTLLFVPIDAPNINIKNDSESDIDIKDFLRSVRELMTISKNEDTSLIIHRITSSDHRYSMNERAVNEGLKPPSNAQILFQQVKSFIQGATNPIDIMRDIPFRIIKGFLWVVSLYLNPWFFDTLEDMLICFTT